MRIGKRCLLPVVVLSFACLAAVAIAADAPALPRLVDLGSEGCVPCKKMAPILEELRTEFADRFIVEFIDVWQTPDAGDKYGIRVIPTQIFLDASGKEQFRHEGFYSREDILAKWRELGVDVGTAEAETFSRWQPAGPDDRPVEAVCSLCDGEIHPRARVEAPTEDGDYRLCSMHHFFVVASTLVAETSAVAEHAAVAEAAGGTMVPVRSAVYLYGLDESSGAPSIRAYADRDAALAARAEAGGSIMDFPALASKELASRCGFCQRVAYPEEAAIVKLGGLQLQACCGGCAMGIAARMASEVEVRDRDRLTGEPIDVTIYQGSVASVEPSTAVAWSGQRVQPDGTRVPASCFHQGLFASPENLRRWVEANPLETGEMVTIGSALADKMALSPQQILQACRNGAFAP